MRQPSLILALGLALAATPALADKRFLQGKVVFADRQSKTSAAVGEEVQCQDTGGRDITKAGGRFTILLPRVLVPGDIVTLHVEPTGWRIWQPVAGEVTLPVNPAKDEVTVTLLQVGDRRLLSEAAVENLLFAAVKQSREQVRPDGGPTQIQIDRYLEEWAGHQGFAPYEVKLEVERWIDKVEAQSDDLHRLALAAFTKNSFGRAAELATQWAADNESKQRKGEKSAKRYWVEASQGYRLAGDARYDDYRFADALDLYRKALALASRERSAVTWAAIQADIGSAARELGMRAEAEVGSRHLDESIGAYRAALEVRTRTSLPRQWAWSQRSLGLALQQRGSRTPGDAGVTLLAQAVAAYRAALEVYARASAPREWANLQHDLAAASQEEGSRSEAKEGRVLLGQAVEAYRAALEVYTHADARRQWGKIQADLGTALEEQGNLTEGEPGRALLAQAVEAYRAALEVHARASAPREWATIQNNLGAALEAEASRSPPDAAQGLRQQAAEAYRAAAEVPVRTSPFELVHSIVVTNGASSSRVGTGAP